MDQTMFKAYLGILRELAKVIRQLTEQARQKLQEVRADNVKGVDDCIRQEQVLSLSLRGLEQRRDKALKALGLGGVPLSGLIEHAPPELRTETVETVRELRGSYESYTAASSAARAALERVLHQVDRMLAEEKQAVQAREAVHQNPRQTDEPPAPPPGGHGADFKA